MMSNLNKCKQIRLNCDNNCHSELLISNLLYLLYQLSVKEIIVGG